MPKASGFLPLFFSFTSGVLITALILVFPWSRRSNPLRHRQLDRSEVPENAPDDCPGLQSENAGCPNQEICASGEAREPDPAFSEISKNMSKIKKKIVILSGKGGVGKSSVSSQLSWLLQERGFDIGLLDVDVCGPSIPMMTGSKGAEVHACADGWTPVYVENNLAVMSIGYLLPDENDAVIWRGPKKNGLIRQFLSDVIWGHLDMLIIDTPPGKNFINEINCTGTSDEHLSLVTYLQEAGIDGIVLVTTPQEASLQDVRREINFCKKVQAPIIGLIENMTDSVFDINNRDAAKETCKRMAIPYIGKISMDHSILEACESGVSVSTINPNAPCLPDLNKVLNDILMNLKLPQMPISNEVTGGVEFQTKKED